MTVRDAGDPGRYTYTFKIVVGSYVAGSELGGGNIQFHDRPSPCGE